MVGALDMQIPGIKLVLDKRNGISLARKELELELEVNFYQLDIIVITFIVLLLL